MLKERKYTKQITANIMMDSSGRILDIGGRLTSSLVDALLSSCKRDEILTTRKFLRH